MRTLLFVLSFLILLLWLHFRIEFSISELCSIWIVKIIMFTIVKNEDVGKEYEDNNECDYDIADNNFVEDGDDVVVDVAVKMVITIFVKNTVAEWTASSISSAVSVNVLIFLSLWTNKTIIIT